MRVLVGVLLLFLWCEYSSAQTLGVPRLVNYTTRDYNEGPQNFNVAQDARGIIYVTNVSGLMEYDGKNWSTVGVGRNTLAVSVAIAEDHRIYVGGLNEFGRIIKGKQKPLAFESLSESLPDSLQSFSFVWQTLAIGKTVHFNAGEFIFTYKDGELSHTKPPARGPNDDIKMYHANGTIWVSDTTNGLYQFDGTKFRDLPQGSFFTGKHIVAIVPFMKEKWLITTREGGIYIYSQEEDDLIVPFANDYQDLLAASVPFGMRKLSNGELAVNTLQSGVFFFDQSQRLIRRIDREQGLQNSQVIGIMEDANNLLWCALDNGVSTIDMSGKFSFSYEGEEFFGAIQDLQKVDNSLFVATGQGLFKANLSDSFPKLNHVDAVPGLCNDILEFDDQLLVVGSGIYAIDTGMRVSKISQFQGRVLYRMRSPNNMLIAGGNSGILVLTYDSTGWHTGFSEPDFPDEVYNIDQIGNSNSFWISTLGAIYRAKFDKGYTDMSYEVVDDPIFEDRMISMVKYSGRTLFSQLDQLIEYRNGKFEHSELLKSMRNRFLFRLSTSQDHTWISTGPRVYHHTKNNIDSTTFLGIDIGGVNALLPERGGNCWIGGDDALLYYKHQNQAVERPFQCNIRRISQGDSLIYSGFFEKDGKISFKQTEVPNFDYENNSFTFEFAASWYHDKNLEYSFMLEGYDSKFSEWSADNKANYTSLPEGEYVFKVKARNIHNQESIVAEYRFVVEPPWYRTWWAYTILVVGSILVIWIIVYLYARRLRAAKKRLESIVRARTIELGEKNEKLEIINNEITYQKALVEQKNKDITDSILYAEKIQKALLTSRKQLDEYFDDYFLMYRPKDILSGDFYWAYQLDVGETVLKIWLAVDCTGHGVPGSLMSMLGNSYLSKIIIEDRIHDPGKILDELREHIISALSQEDKSVTRDGMDLALCVYNEKAGILKYSGAKNPLWIIRRNGDPAENYDRKLMGEDAILYEWKADNQAVGYAENARPFSVHEIKTEPGDILVVFSDGYADQFGGNENKKIQQKKFKELLLAGPSNMEEMQAYLESFFEKWRGDQEQIDDVCVFGVRIR